MIDEAYYILGVVNSSRNNLEESELYLRKAIYLNPEYYEALIQLAYIVETKGKIEEATRLKKRAKRIYET